MSTTIKTSINIERGDEDIEVLITGTLQRASRGRREQGQFGQQLEPDEPARMVDVTATKGDMEFALSPYEMERAKEELWEEVAAMAELGQQERREA
jgi:hypothetical protein